MAHRPPGERRCGPADAGEADVEASRSSRLPPRHQAARIGLATIARLLADSEPFRLRWALQHWPYPIAKLIRSLIPPATNRPAALLESETWILKTAWDRLNLEGRLALAWPESSSAKLGGTGTLRGARKGSSSDVVHIHGNGSKDSPCTRVKGAICREPRNEPDRARFTSGPGYRPAGRGRRSAGMAPASVAPPFQPGTTPESLGSRRRPSPSSRLAGNDIGTPIAIDRPEILWRASGLGRAGLVAQMTAARLATRLAMGIEIPLAHTIVDRLLGFDRSFGESRLQLTPVEWGVWTFLFLRGSIRSTRKGDRILERARAPLVIRACGELTLDRVGPDPFDPSGLGSIVTVRWPVRIGDIAGAARLWLPESVVSLWLAAPIRPGDGDTALASRPEIFDPAAESLRRVPRGELASSWRALAGLVTMSQGLRRLRIGGVLPLSESPADRHSGQSERSRRLDPRPRRSR